MSVSASPLVSPRPDDRITAIDALRGTALIGLFLLHALEHFDFLSYPATTPGWLKPLDAGTDDLIYFLFAGKAYGIFALMFGVSFSLILSSWSRRDGSAGVRYLWRLAVLGMVGFMHSLIYCGDILTILAVIGAPLVLVNRWGDRALLFAAALLVAQLPTLWLVGGLLRGAAPPAEPYHREIYNQLALIYAHGSLIEVLRANLWQGQRARFWFTVETGRALQLAGLFLVGLVVGRNGVLARPQLHNQVLQIILLSGALAFVILFPLKRLAETSGLSAMSRYEVAGLAATYCNLAQMTVWASGFVLLYPRLQTLRLVHGLAALGRTSLTCYVVQSAICVPMFYGYGLGLYRVMGPFYSVSLGIAVAVLQCVLAAVWLQHFRYGPLEWLWRAATFRTWTLPLRLSRPEDGVARLPASGVSKPT